MGSGRIHEETRVKNTFVIISKHDHVLINLKLLHVKISFLF